MRALATGTKLGEPTNELRFTFEGFTTGDRAALQAYLEQALPKAYSIYGRPAFDLDVKVILDPELHVLQGGVYDSAANEIRMSTLSGNLPEDSFILMILVLYAFHDDAAFFYDAWEEGFAGAAATAIQTSPGISPGYDPIDPGPFYATSVYEPQNQPDLGGPTYYPASGFRGMLVWRVALARSAWFKAYIEDNQFFNKFNAAYYQNHSEDLPGNVPALRVLGSQVLPSLEGMPFQEWFQRQHVLDTSVRIGPKLFIWNIPLTQAVALLAEHFFTTAGGDEEPRGGQARTTYWSYDFAVSLYAEEGNTIDIPSTGEGAGEGFLIPTFFNIGGPQLVTVQVDLGSHRLMLPFPYGVRGFEAGENNLYGGIIGALEGDIQVTAGQGLAEVAVQRAVWGDRITQGPLSPTQLEITFTNQQDQAMTRKVNVAWDSYVLFHHGGGQVRMNRTWSADGLGLHLISFPLRPLTQDLASLLDISADRLLVARWDPALPTDNKYRIWPRTDPVEPGRAYWLRVLDDVSLSLTGVLHPEDNAFVVPLHVGWNMIGSPRQTPVAVEDLEFEAEGEQPVSYAEAVASGLIQEFIYRWSPQNGYVEAPQLTAFKGYWVRCMNSDGALLRFPPVGSISQQRPSQPKVAGRELDWKLKLAAQAGGISCSAACLGVAADASEGLDRYDCQAPPAFGPQVTVRFRDPAGGSTATYLRDVRPASPGRRTWELQVGSALPHQPVRLTWPDMSELPADARPVLVDAASGKRLYMRTTSAYELPADETGVSRRLRIEMEPASSRALMVTSMAARQAGGGPVQITFTLSAPAKVRARILNIAGRPIHDLLGGERSAGMGSLSWNLRDKTGRLVPSGLYLVELHAADESGRQTRSMRSLYVTR